MSEHTPSDKGTVSMSGVSHGEIDRLGESALGRELRRLLDRSRPSDIPPQRSGNFDNRL